MIIDENNGCVTKSKLTITVKTLSKYNDLSWVAAKQSDKHLGRKHTKEEKDVLTNRRISRLTVDTRTERVKQKMKNGAPYVLLFCCY